LQLAIMGLHLLKGVAEFPGSNARFKIHHKE
jgi:hypothetical protein